jgi:hypothetical protein
MDIKRVAVIGAGTMGNGIAHVFARSGYAVILCDVEQQFLERGLATITKNLDREVAKNKITSEDKASALQKIEPVTERAKLADCYFIVEAATEKFEIKTEIFRDLDRRARPEVILASNTFVHLHHQARCVDQAARQSHWHALLQSRAGDEVGRGDPRAGYIARNLCDGSRFIGEARQDAGRGERRTGIRLQPRAHAAAERSHVCGDGGRGHRRRRSTKCSSWAWRIPWARSRSPTLSASTFASTSCASCSMGSVIPSTGHVRC